MNLPRASGILLHPTSLPGRFGVGDLGDEAYRFADFLVASGQSLWQVLPLGPTDEGGSPYSSYSAFAGNSLLISPDKLVEDGLLDRSDLVDVALRETERVDFDQARKAKNACLRRAFERFQANDDALRKSFASFAQENASWLDDYALFQALKKANDGAGWIEWDRPLASREPEALSRARIELRDEIDAQKFFQYLFFKQWQALKAFCNQRGIRIIGDVPIFVAHDSADVWTNREQFKLDEHGRPTVVAGVPPDYFSDTGQFWGNPLYKWDRMRAGGFAWWIERLRASFQIFDLVRLDHFRGFAACWEIPAGETTAQNGEWVETPGRELFTAVRGALGEVAIIAEDLGVITPDVVELRKEFGFPGMRVLQFAFSGEEENVNLPENFDRDVVAYTGTHDNDTTVGWFNQLSEMNITEAEKTREFCLNYLQSEGREINWDFIRAVLGSVAGATIIPLQDVLGLGSEARMNTPNTTIGNWRWRLADGSLTAEHSARLKRLTDENIRGRP
ncbi:MAG TPA: 4-alpha-glucanotransferase [Pyrinomonadaceae bacterium]|nr:4-alpha-glucanotransferase [Pyrinomonadaceae bacterium]